MDEHVPGLKITFACKTDVGRVRDHNEDYAIAEAPVEAERRRRGMVFIIADGMGGHQAGEVASERAARTTLEEYYAAPMDDVPASLRHAIQTANNQVYQMAQANVARAGMGTTIVMAAIIGREVHIANVGDSRAYLVRHALRTITQITTDHSFVGEQVQAGILTKEQAKLHPQRNVITRALGSAPTVQVDTYQGDLQEGDIILLCSDGLTEHVTEEKIQELVTHYDPEAAATRLIGLAKEGGGSDNISVIVLRAEPSGVPAPAAIGKSQPLPVGASGQAVQAAAAPRTALPARSEKQGGLSWAWILAGGGAALVIVVVLIGAALILSGKLAGGSSQASPTPTPLPTTTVGPSILPTLTLPAQSAQPTQTIMPTYTPSPTSTPRPPTPTPTETPTPSPTATQAPPSGGDDGGGKKPTPEPPPPATEEPPAPTPLP